MGIGTISQSDYRLNYDSYQKQRLPRGEGISYVANGNTAGWRCLGGTNQFQESMTPTCVVQVP